MVEAESVMGELLFGTMITIFIVSPALAGGWMMATVASLVSRFSLS